MKTKKKQKKKSLNSDQIAMILRYDCIEEDEIARSTIIEIAERFADKLDLNNHEQEEFLKFINSD